MGLIGCVDKLWEKCISGWASDDADHARPVQVDVIVNSLPVATVPCTAFREDLLAAGIGDGCKGFFFDPTAHLRPGRNNLEVHYNGSGLVVPGGRGHWVKRREGDISEPEAAFLAALEARLPELSALPALILWGDKDDAFQAPELAHWQQLLPGARTVMLEGVAHFAASETPAAFAGAIRAWSTEPATGSPGA